MKEEIYLGKMSEMILNKFSIDDAISVMTVLGNTLNKVGYSLASGKDGKHDELWAIPQPII